MPLIKIHTLIHSYIHTYTHTYIHTYMHVGNPNKYKCFDYIQKHCLRHAYSHHHILLLCEHSKGIIQEKIKRPKTKHHNLSLK